MARLIRTEKEVEGRFEEVWLVVEEDPLEQWPAGPGEVVGRPASRADGLGRARGEALYTADLKLPGTLQAAVLRSPFAKARATRVDLTAALAAPGVRGAIGPDDCPRVSAECNYEGAAVAAVCADTLRQARAAVKLIEVDWEQLEPRLDADEAVAADEVLDSRSSERGNLERGLAEADAVVEGTYRTQVVLHNSMETHQSVCRFVGDSLEVYTSTQYVWGVRAELAETLGIEPDRVRVICEYMGGGFGSKNGADDYTYIAIELARRTGRPVRCALSRREEHLVAGNRNATIQRLVVGAREDGTLTALGGEFVNAIGFAGWNSMIEGPMQTLYACPNVRTTAKGAQLNLPPMKAFRAPGYVEGTFGLECLLDELAAKLGLDPLELRRRNHADNEPAVGREYSGKELLECYRRAEPHWERRHEVRARSTETVKRGFGDGVADLVRGRRAAELRVGQNRLERPCDGGHRGGHGVGTGTKTALAQIAAEELGLQLSQVSISVGDTDRGPYATLSAGSSTVPSMGPAVRAAAADARRQLLDLAAQRFDADAEGLSLEGRLDRASGRGAEAARRDRGTARERPDPRHGRPRAEPGRDDGAHLRRPGRRGCGRYPDGRGDCRARRGDPRRRPGDQPARRLEPARGRDHPGDRPHPLGAAAQRPGDRRPPDADPRCLQAADDRRYTGDRRRADRRARCPPDEPRLEGIGEPPIVPIAAAIANAIRDATGADIRSLPITREEMLAALAAARRKDLAEDKLPVAG